MVAEGRESGGNPGTSRILAGCSSGTAILYHRFQFSWNVVEHTFLELD